MSGVKALLSSRPVAYYPELAHAVGGIAPALFFQQIAHWQGKNPDGWVFRTQEELEKELAMSPKVQAAARKHLVERGVLEEKLDGMPRRLYYRPVWDNLELALQTCHRAGTDLPDGQVQTCPSVDTTLKSIDESIEPTPVGAETSSATPKADEFVSFLAEELDGADVPYTGGWRGRHGKQFKEHIAKSVPSETLYKACDRIIERWTGEKHHKLTVEHAVGDVLNGGGPRRLESGQAINGKVAAARRKEGYEWLFGETG